MLGEANVIRSSRHAKTEDFGSLALLGGTRRS